MASRVLLFLSVILFVIANIKAATIEYDHASNSQAGQTYEWSATSSWVGGVVPQAGDDVGILSFVNNNNNDNNIIYNFTRLISIVIIDNLFIYF